MPPPHIGAEEAQAERATAAGILALAQALPTRRIHAVSNLVDLTEWAFVRGFDSAGLRSAMALAMAPETAEEFWLGVLGGPAACVAASVLRRRAPASRFLTLLRAAALTNFRRACEAVSCPPPAGRLIADPVLLLAFSNSFLGYERHGILEMQAGLSSLDPVKGMVLRWTSQEWNVAQSAPDSHPHGPWVPEAVRNELDSFPANLFPRTTGTDHRCDIANLPYFGRACRICGVSPQPSPRSLRAHPGACTFEWNYRRSVWECARCGRPEDLEIDSPAELGLGHAQMDADLVEEWVRGGRA